MQNAKNRLLCTPPSGHAHHNRRQGVGHAVGSEQGDDGARAPIDEPGDEAEEKYGRKMPPTLHGMTGMGGKSMSLS